MVTSIGNQQHQAHRVHHPAVPVAVHLLAQAVPVPAVHPALVVAQARAVVVHQVGLAHHHQVVVQVLALLRRAHRVHLHQDITRAILWS